jgi:hypothetical protein
VQDFPSDSDFEDDKFFGHESADTEATVQHGNSGLASSRPRDDGNDTQRNANETIPATNLRDPHLAAITVGAPTAVDLLLKHTPPKVNNIEGEVVQVQDREVSAQDCGQFKHEPEIGAISDDPQTMAIHKPDQASSLDIAKHHQHNTDHVEDAALQVLRTGINGPDLQSENQNGGKMMVEADYAVCRVIEAAQGSAGKLVNLLAKHFSAFGDECRFEGRRVRFLKRAQIFVADVWAALRGAGRAAFDDVDQLTMFAGKSTTQMQYACDGPLHHGNNDAILSCRCIRMQRSAAMSTTCHKMSERDSRALTNLLVGLWADYRVPQMLHSLGVMVYSPPLEHHIRDRKHIAVGHSWELELR